MYVNKESTTDKIKQTAMRLLTQRDHSASELKQKLILKGYTLDEVNPILLLLAQSGAINDQRYTENHIRFRRSKGYGPEWISQELRLKGIPIEMIAQHLDIADNAWFTEVRKVWQKKFKGKLPADFKSKAKQMRFLQYRGYTREHIDSLFDKDL